MALPAGKARHDQFTTADGDVVDIRSLSAAEVRKLSEMEGEESNLFTLAVATNETPEAVKSWYDSAPAGDVRDLLGAVMAISGLGEGARFRQRQGDDAGLVGATE